VWKRSSDMPSRWVLGIELPLAIPGGGGWEKLKTETPALTGGPFCLRSHWESC